MIYAMSDIHGCIGDLQKQMEQVDLCGENSIVFLGDYIDYGDSSYQVLKYIWDLQKKYGAEKVVALKGNHEQMFLEWIDDYKNPDPDGTEDFVTFNDWLRSDFECGANTISTFISGQQMDFLNQISRTCSLETISREAVQMILSEHKEMIWWIQEMRSCFETENQIFVHAGVDDAGVGGVKLLADGKLAGAAHFQPRGNGGHSVQQKRIGLDGIAQRNVWAENLLDGPHAGL